MAKEKTHKAGAAQIANTAERKDALKATISSIEKNFGEGSIMVLGKQPIKKVEVWDTGCLSLNAALGVGGIPKGRIIEVYGPEAGGKSSLCLHVVAEVQKQGGTAAYIDAECAMDLTYAQNIGVDVGSLLFSQPDSGEQGLEIVEALVRSGTVDIVVVDSVAALTPQAELDGDMGDATMGAQARLMGQALRKLTAVVSKSRCSILFINQLRQAIGCVTLDTFVSWRRISQNS